MPEFLLTGRDAYGRRVTECIYAPTADVAVDLMQDRGYRDVVLHTDNASAHHFYYAQLANHASPQAFLELMRETPARVQALRFLTFALKKFVPITLMCILILVVRRHRQLPWDWVDAVTIGWISLPLLVALVVFLISAIPDKPHQLLRAFQEDCAWGRWLPALRKLECLEAMEYPIPPVVRIAEKAKIMAGLGRLHRALGDVQPLGDGEVMPAWAHLTLLARIHAIAGERDSAVGYLQQAVEIAPNMPEALLELAQWEVREHRRPAAAQYYLDEARQHAIADVLEPIAKTVQGQIHLERGRLDAAGKLLEEAHGEAQRFGHWSPALRAVRDEISWTLALVHAGRGKLTRAKRHYLRAKPRLEAHGLTHHMQRYEDAVSGGGAAQRSCRVAS